MSLLVPEFTDPYRVTPITDAYAWIGRLYVDMAGGGGRVEIFVHPSADDAMANQAPIQRIGIALGQTTAQGGAFPSLGDLMANPDFATAFGTIRQILYDALKAMPDFAGSVDVP